MKRILALLLVLAMSFGLFAGCRTQTPDVTTEPTTQATEQAQPDLQLEKAIEYLRAFYKNAAEKTPMDYTRLGTVRIGLTAYDVVWSTDAPEEVLKIVKNEDGTYTIDIDEEAFKESTEPTPYVLTATITGLDGRELTISWNHIVPAAIDEESIDVLKKAYALAPGESMEGTYTVIGVIKAIKTPYDPSYKNITVTIEIPGAEDMPLVCYRLKGDGADKLAVGDTITVTGSFTNYNGQVQFAAGCILEAVESGGGAAPVAPENPVDILKQAYALAPGESLPYTCALSGVITFVDQAYSPDFGNITVTMKTNGYTIKCYRIKGDGVDQLNVNDEITVSGQITNYNGTIEFAAGSMLVSRVDHEPPAKQPDPTPGSTLTVGQAYNVGMGKDHDTYTEGNYYITGTIVSIENDVYGNMHISDGTGKLMIYGTWSEDGNTRYDKLNPKPAVGDTVTLYGKIGRYGSNPQMKNAWIIGAKGDAPVIPDAPSVDKVTELVAGTPYRFGMAQGNLENAVYYLAGGMDGYYMKTTADPAAAINVYVEETAGGYYFYTKNGDEKLYINMVVSADGAHVNGAYEATASTVYTYDTTLIATVDGVPYWFGTRNDKTYTTMGPCKVELAGFFGEFYVGSEETPDEPEQPEDPELSEITADKAYKFGMAQGNLDNKVFYLKGGMDGYYMATTDDVTAAIDVYVEVTEGGYYFYTKNGDEKLYINMVVNGTHVNGAYEATASTVYTYNAEKNTLIAIVNDAEYWFSTRNDNTYTTMGPNKVSYNGFFGQFIDLNAEPEQPEQPEDPENSEITADKAYKFGMAQGNLDNKVFYLKGGMDGYYMATTDDVTAAIDVYVEVTEGGYYFYTKSGETKQYINMVVNGTHVNGAYEATASTVYTYNAEKNTLIAIVNDAEYWFSTRNDNTYTTMGPNKVSYNGFFGQFIDLNAEPECKHTNTKVEGAKDATCTTKGYTGDIVCVDCGETITKGEDIPTIAHNFVNGICSACGEKDPNYTPEEPSTPAGGKADFNTIVLPSSKPNGDSSYTATYTTANGWVTKNSAIQCGGTADINPQFTVIGPDNTHKAVCLNGKTSAPGSITSPTLTGGISKLTLKYTKMFTDTKLSATITITDLTTGAVYTNTAAIEWEKNTKYEVETFEWVLETPITGDFTIEIVNDCPTGQNGNKDRMTILELAWEASAAPEQPECKHTNTEKKGAVEATCTTKGYTGDIVCVDCGETITKGEDIPAIPHNFVNGTCSVCGEKDPNYTPEEPSTGLDAGKAYKFGMIQKNVSATDVYYLAGGMSSYYMATTKDVNAAIDVYVEATEGGYYFYTLSGETKLYINMVVSGTHVNGAYEAAASTVYSYDAENNTLIAIVNNSEYWFGTRNDKTYTTVGPCAVSYAGFFCQLYDLNEEPEEPECKHTNTEKKGAVEATCTTKGYTGDTVCTDCGETITKGEDIPAIPHNFVNGTCSVCGEKDPNYTPEEPSTGLDAGKAYKFGMIQKNVSATDVYYLAGGMSSYYMATTKDVNAAIDVYVEATEGGYYFYTMDGETKLYINMVVSGTHVNGAYEATASTVYTYDAENNTLIAIVNNSEYWFGTRNDKTYTTVGPCAVSYAGFFCQLYPVVEENPDAPFCQHLHTDNKGAVEATCTTKGYTGDTVCTDCGETITKGEDIPTIAHNFVNGTCSVCGEKDPNYTPEEPSTGLEAGKAYKFGMIQKNVSATDVYYLAGGMSSYYMATTKDVNAAIDVYVEATEGGYYFYTLDGETKLYINMVVSGTHVNGAYEAAASTVYTYDAENNTLIAIVNNSEYWFGTRNDKTYTTVGPCAVSYAGFFCQFYDLNAESACEHTNTKVEGTVEATCTTDGYTGDTVCTDCGEVLHKGEISAALGHPFVDGICPKCGEADPNYVPLEPEEIGKAYKLYLDRGEKWYFAGAMGYSSLTTTDNMNAATDVYLEEVEGGFRFYFMDGETKTYIDIYEYETGKVRVRLTTEPTAVFIFNKDLGIYQTAIYTAYVAGAHRFLGANGLETSISAWDVKYITGENIGDLGLRYFITSFVEVAGEDPEEPAAPAGDKADFNTIVTPSPNGYGQYDKSFASANGWTTVNCAIQSGGPAGCSNPQFTVIGPDNTHKAVCLNGKTSAPGSLTSPVLTGGISKLTMRYTHMFSDKNLSVTITVTDKATGATYTKVVEQTVAGTADKFTVENVEWVLETPVTGEFAIEVVNNCPSGSTSNKDRMTILELAWEGAVAAHEHSYTVTSTATCTADGEATYTCECGDTYTEAAPKLGHIDENLDVECDREGCTSKVAPAANSKLSTFTANCLGSKLSTDYQYYVEGTIVEVLDAKNGIFLIDDGTGETFYFRLPKNADGVSHASWAIKLTLGDKVSVYGKVNKYTTSTAPNGQFWPAIQGGVVTVLEQHPHDFTFSPATCSAPAYCACGQSHGEPLGCADNNGDDLCDDCGKNVKLVYEYIAIRTDNNSGVLDTAAGTYTWGNTNFDVQVVKGTSSQLYSTAKDHMRVYNGNQFVLANKNGLAVKTITVYLTNATQVGNLEKYLTGYTYTKDTENFTVTIEVNSTANLTLSITATTQIKGVEFGYEK